MPCPDSSKRQFFEVKRCANRLKRTATHSLATQRYKSYMNNLAMNSLSPASIEVEFKNSLVKLKELIQLVSLPSSDSNFCANKDNYWKIRIEHVDEAIVDSINSLENLKNRLVKIMDTDSTKDRIPTNETHIFRNDLEQNFELKAGQISAGALPETENFQLPARQENTSEIRPRFKKNRVTKSSKRPSLPKSSATNRYSSPCSSSITSINAFQNSGQDQVASKTHFSDSSASTSKRCKEPERDPCTKQAVVNSTSVNNLIGKYVLKRFEDGALFYGIILSLENNNYKVVII